VGNDEKLCSHRLISFWVVFLTLGTSQGYFMYVDNMLGKTGDKAQLLSETFQVVATGNNERLDIQFSETLSFHNHIWKASRNLGVSSAKISKTCLDVRYKKKLQWSRPPENSTTTNYNHSLPKISSGCGPREKELVSSIWKWWVTTKTHTPIG